MRSTLSFFPVVLALLPSLVSAHGFVANIIVNGQSFKGSAPGAASNPSAIRQITTNSPVKGAQNPDINCGPGATVAPNVMQVMPGDKLEFDWRDGGDMQHWPHNTGPIITYMASCGEQSCAQFDSTKAKWFKISQDGREGNAWVQQRLMNGQTVSSQIPGTLKAGNYMIRHEIVALHLATSMGGAEFYPSCSQAKVGGNGSGGPKPEELVAFPGGYSDNDPGIFDPDVFNPGSAYTFPGPPIAAFVNAGGSGGSGASGAPNASPPAGQPKKNTKASNGSCHLKRASQSAENARRSPSRLRRMIHDHLKREPYNARLRPSRLSRMMRDVTLPDSVARL